MTPDNLSEALEEAARHLPDPHKPDSLSWGGGFAHQLLTHGEAAVKAGIGPIFDRFLAHGSVEQAQLAAMTYPELAGATSGILAGLERRDLDGDTQTDLWGALGRAVQAGLLSWMPAYRDAIRDADGALRNPLLAAALVHDHTWFMEQLPALVGKKPGPAATVLWFAVQACTRAELDRVEAALASVDTSETIRKRLLEVVERQRAVAPDDDAPPRF